MGPFATKPKIRVPKRVQNRVKNDLPKIPNKPTACTFVNSCDFFSKMAKNDVFSFFSKKKTCFFDSAEKRLFLIGETHLKSPKIAFFGFFKIDLSWLSNKPTACSFFREKNFSKKWFCKKALFLMVKITRFFKKIHFFHFLTKMKKCEKYKSFCSCRVAKKSKKWNTKMREKKMSKNTFFHFFEKSLEPPGQKIDFLKK